MNVSFAASFFMYFLSFIFLTVFFQFALEQVEKEFEGSDQNYY